MLNGMVAWWKSQAQQAGAASVVDLIVLVGGGMPKRIVASVDSSCDIASASAAPA